MFNFCARHLMQQLPYIIKKIYDYPLLFLIICVKSPRGKSSTTHVAVICGDNFVLPSTVWVPILRCIAGIHGSWVVWTLV